MEHSPIAVSVIIPVKNGAPTLRACLQGIFDQKFDGETEVILIDSASTDDTLKIAAEFPVRIHKIQPQDFNHGKTRNLGVEMARGEFVVMTVQDAVPITRNWLQNLIEPFADSQIKGVCGLQTVPHDRDKNPFQWFRPVNKNPQAKTVVFESSQSFLNLSSQEQYRVCRWDNVNAAYRRSALLETPFRAVSFAEDALWARDALTKNYALTYQPNARVEHYHHENFSFRFRRTYTVMYFIYAEFGYLKKSNSILLSLLKCAFFFIKNREFKFSEKIRWIRYNSSLIFSSALATYIFSFLARFAKEKTLQKSHLFFCKTAPQAPQPKIKST